MSDNIITIKHLKKHYQALPVLLDINLEVNRGDVDVYKRQILY